MESNIESTQQGILLSSSKWVMPKMTKPFGFLKGLTKVIYGFATYQLQIQSSPTITATSIFNAATGFTELLESFDFKKDAGQVGWQLISRSLLDALFKLISESIRDLNLRDNFFNSHLNQLDDLDEKLNAVFNSEQYFIYLDFFKHPEKHPLLEASNAIFDEYLQIFGYNPYQRKNILERLRYYFVFSLVEEWRKAPATYLILTEKLDTPFANAESKSYQWLCYRKSLIHEIKKPVFQETFSLQDIYIPLRAYYEIKKDDIQSKDKGKAIMIDDYLSKWVENNDKTDCIKIISGGPGYGKSSLLKMFAAKLAEQEKNVLFIPLHRFNYRFNLREELEESIKIFLNYDKYITTFNPLDESDLVIIFDGLDELAMQGGLLANIAQDFVRDVKSKVDNYNYTSAKLKVIISGRDVIVEQNESSFRKEGQHLRLLPYLIDKETKELFEKQDNLIDEDQRSIWWTKYGKLMGKEYEGMPPELKKQDLDKITAQALLNYLVALSYEQGEIDFSKNINLNEVYATLLEGVYKRSYSSGGGIRNISSLSKENFFRLLEEVAVSVWHGDGTKTSIRDIKTHFDSSRLNSLMEQFTADAEKGVISLLAAFYFRQAGAQMDGSQTFEFTHKSFGEYLMARRIVKKIQFICRKIKESKENWDVGYDIKKGLQDWIELFGPKVLDKDIVKFIRNEINSIEQETLKNFHSIICELINYELKNGLPVELLPNHSYKKENLYAVNAEKGLFVIRSILAMKTNICSEIKWTPKTGFGNLLKRIVEQKDNPFSTAFMLQFFNNINIKNQLLDVNDLTGANFSGSNLEGTSFFEAHLAKANLCGANLCGANLYGANLYEANLEGVDLSGTIFFEKVRNLMTAKNLVNAIFPGRFLPPAKNSH